MTEGNSVNARAQIRRKDRASYDAQTVYAILDEALVAHVGFVADGQVFVIPTTYARQGQTLYVHGGAATRFFKVLRKAAPVCVTVTLLDGLVLARSAFHHSMNYRSVVVFGEARDVTEPEEKDRALAAMVERMEPGRSAHARAPNARELGLTCVLAIAIDEASAKMRTGPPIDDEADMAVDVWAGEIPLRTVRLEGVRDQTPARGVVP
jgi:uncharacterized protein